MKHTELRERERIKRYRPNEGSMNIAVDWLVRAFALILKHLWGFLHRRTLTPAITKLESKAFALD